MWVQLLHVMTGLCLLGSLFLSVISTASHRWIEKSVENSTYHLGLWKFCDMKQCVMSSRVPFITEGHLFGKRTLTVCLLSVDEWLGVELRIENFDLSGGLLLGLMLTSRIASMIL